MELNIDQIESILPHRYPFLLVDKITECVPGESAKGVKCVTANEPFFQGHFPGFKVVEGRSNRRYTDEEAIAKALRKAGFKVADIYKPRELLGLTAMEKLVGKKKFGELAGSYIVKPAGSPTLVPEDDKRPPLNTAAKAAEDFNDNFEEENNHG